MADRGGRCATALADVPGSGEVSASCGAAVSSSNDDGSKPASTSSAPTTVVAVLWIGVESGTPVLASN